MALVDVEDLFRREPLFGLDWALFCGSLLATLEGTETRKLCLIVGARQTA